MKIKKLFSVLLVVAIISTLFYGCGGNSENENVNNEQENQSKTIAVIAKGESHAFWQAVKDGAEDAGKRYGYKITFRGPSSENSSELPSQKEMVQTALSNNAAGLVVATIGEGFTDVLEQAYDKKIPVVRIMPNMPVAVGEGMILYTSNDFVSMEDVQGFLNSMQFAGVLDRIDEDKIDAASCVSGCGPAFAFMFCEALADGVVKCGLPRDKALLYAAQTLAGSATMLMETGEHPGKLKDAVCSPAGSTIEGVKALEDGAFRASAMNAVKMAYKRTLELFK